MLLKMVFIKDDAQKLANFHSVVTSVYFSTLILILYWTNGIYSSGNYNFSCIIFIIIIAESIKYFSSITYFKIYDVNLSKKYNDNKLASSIIKSIFSKAKIKEGFINFVFVSSTIMAYFVAAILYGAEVFSKHEETLMFSSLLSVLTVFPACLNLGSQSIVSLLLGSKPVNKLENLIYQNFYLTMLGAWLGAFVIPLDWDRPWQVWPIPCTSGAMIGYLVSHVIMLVKVKAGFKKKMKRAI